MTFVSFYIDGTVRTCRTQVLAGTTTNTFLFVDDRLLDRVRIVLIDRNHLNCLRRTMPLAVSALNPIGHRNTILMDCNGMTNLDSRLISSCNQFNGTRRADFRAFHTFRTTITALIRHLWLHEILQLGRRTKHIVRTCRNAKLASSTMLSKVTDSKRARRRQRRKAFGSQFRFDISQTAIYFLLYFILVCRQFGTGIRPFVRILLILTKSFLLFFLRMQSCSSGYDTDCREETTT